MVPVAISNAATNRARTAAIVGAIHRPSECARERRSAADESPIENTTAPLIGCESTEITR
jgi:hypothetical protein